jgi:hypothetical protein
MSVPVKVHEQHKTDTRAQRFNAWLAIHITQIVGTMWCAYAFACIAFVGLPAVLGLTLVPARFSSIVLWVSSEFLQLILLSVIMVGQNVQSKAADARSQATYDDALVILDRLDTDTAGGITEILTAIAELKK